jgi:DNA-binding NtrC family response regulator
MEEQAVTKVFLVDDDTLLLKSLEIAFSMQTNYVVETFVTGEGCVANLSQNPDVIILDYYLIGMDLLEMTGLETLDKIKQFNADIPVVMLSSEDKIEVAIECMQHGALDYVVKSETAFVRLQKIIETILQHQKVKNELKWYMEHL